MNLDAKLATVKRNISELETAIRERRDAVASLQNELNQLAAKLHEQVGAHNVLLELLDDSPGDEMSE
jgi:uncharacterized coiled-coil protein SlyX